MNLYELNKYEAIQRGIDNRMTNFCNHLKSNDIPYKVIEEEEYHYTLQISSDYTKEVSLLYLNDKEINYISELKSFIIYIS